LISENDANFIKKLLKNKKVILEIESLFSNQVKPSNNVIGKICNKEKEILICAHHDTYWEVPCLGATDNATGVASLLEIARIISLQSKIKNTYKTIKFVSFSSEEYFTIGSFIYCLPYLAKLFLLIEPEIIYHFFKKLLLPKPRNLENIELVINIDDVGNDGPLTIGINYSLEKINRIFRFSNKNIEDVIKKHYENMKDEVYFFENIVDEGDGIWFNKFKIPVISISRASTKYGIYRHSTNDTIKLVNFENLKKTTNFIYEIIKLFCF
jgi:Zn-dependent M28 family amino/carboxypeptidase